MEVHMLLTVLVLVLCLSFVLRRSIRRSRAQATLHQIGDAAVAHLTLNENADAFSNRPALIFPVVLSTGLRGKRNHTITTVNYGPHWRVLRCNITAEILHPSRIASLAPLQEEAAQALFADMSARVKGGAGEVAVRADLNAAAFSLAARLCFGDGVDEPRLRAMDRVLQEFADVVGELNPVYDGTWRSQLLYWRPLRRLAGFLGRQAELYLPLIEALRRQPRPGRSVGGLSYVESLIKLHIPVDDDGDVWRELRDEEVVTLVSEFLGAGTGTVAACVEWVLAHLANQPDVQSKLRREIDGECCIKSIRGTMPYMHAVVLETLRMHPPRAVRHARNPQRGCGGARCDGRACPRRAGAVQFR
jgi:cytochrome P450